MITLVQIYTEKEHAVEALKFLPVFIPSRWMNNPTHCSAAVIQHGDVEKYVPGVSSEALESPLPDLSASCVSVKMWLVLVLAIFLLL